LLAVPACCASVPLCLGVWHGCWDKVIQILLVEDLKMIWTPLQGMMITEMWIDRIARTVGKSPEEIRLLNLYRENDKTYYGQVLDCCQLRACWDHVRANPLPRPLLDSPRHNADFVVAFYRRLRMTGWRSLTDGRR